MEYLRSCDPIFKSVPDEKFQSFFYNGIPTKPYWKNVFIEVWQFQSFFYNGIPTKLEYVKAEDTKLKSFNPSFTMEYLRSQYQTLVKEANRMFQSFFYNGIPTKLLKSV